MILFENDDAIRAEQKRVAKTQRGEVVSAETIRRELIEDARELRTHARAREFSYLLFVLPVLIAVASALATWLVSWAMR